MDIRPLPAMPASLLLSFAAVLSSLPIPTDAASWAVLAAGSSGYDNYRHQADLCHAYQILRRGGFPRDRIITMAVDDVATADRNPFYGKLFNAPDPTGPGTDVYADCHIDYRGADVTAANFLGILLGNGTTGGSGRMLDSTPDDHVLVFYTDHGGENKLCFPGPDGAMCGDELHADEFQAALRTMHAQHQYGKMVIFIEACRSGSMLMDLPDDLDIYGVTAVPGGVDSLAVYCFPSESVVNGTGLGTCLGDLFAVYWMEALQQGRANESLSHLFADISQTVLIHSALGHAGIEQNQHYGDPTVGNETLRQLFFPDARGPLIHFLALPHQGPWIAPRATMPNCHRRPGARSSSTGSPDAGADTCELDTGIRCSWVPRLCAVRGRAECMARQGGAATCECNAGLCANQMGVCSPASLPLAADPRTEGPPPMLALTLVGLAATAAMALALTARAVKPRASRRPESEPLLRACS